MLGATDWAATLAEEDLGLLMNEKLTRSQQCASVALKANYLLGCIRKSLASRDREGTIPICGAAMKLQLQCCPVDHTCNTFCVRETNWRESSIGLLRWWGLEHLRVEEELGLEPEEEKAKGECNCCI